MLIFASTLITLSYNNLFKSSILGNAFLKRSGNSCDVRYVETPIGFDVSEKDSSNRQMTSADLANR